ncbi:AaceriAEL280Wp [[Ashbya] aceris (nom. inval.)]|nr:AaceriAEL280Wp [[Ashbya] aceris (nom. inval.)]
MSLSNSQSVNLSQYTQEQIKTLKDAFQLLDEDGDGAISAQDLDKIWQSLGKKMSSEEIAEMLARSEMEQVTFPAFLSLMSGSLGALPDEGDIRDALELFSRTDDADLNCDAGELREYLRMSGFAVDEAFERLLRSFVAQSVTGQQLFKGKRFLDAVSE